MGEEPEGAPKAEDTGALLASELSSPLAGAAGGALDGATVTGVAADGATVTGVAAAGAGVMGI